MAEKIPALARAGCLLLQLRAKELSAREFLEWARDASRIARDAGIRLIVNDRVDIALAAGADGVHLGREDLSPVSARKLLGASAIIGLSTHDLREAEEAEAEPVDYVAVGPIFETTSKDEPDPVVGLDGARAARAVVSKPLVAIGGITLELAADVLATGVDGVAVISALRAPSVASLESLAKTWLSIPKTSKEER
jgi:thiamine-phosphate pyrophosphorylase